MIEDTLRRAVERLEDLRKDAPPGPWEPNLYWSRFEMYSGLDHDKMGNESLVLDAQEIATVDLVGMLHRTIDAQLAILNEGLYQLENAPEGYMANEFNLFGRLAKAILGES